MPLGDPYASLPELKSYLKITDTADDDELDDALASATREVEDHCDRQFNKETSATARVYLPEGCDWVIVDDFHTTTDLVVKSDEDDDGTYETTWAATDYQLHPLNGVVRGRTGFPYWEVKPVGSGLLFPTWGERATVQVTAQWGWASVPAPVKQACLIIAAETFKLKDAPFGVAGFGEFGAVRVKDNPLAARKLMPYERDQQLVVRR
jgi:hypothetical protein